MKRIEFKITIESTTFAKGIIKQIFTATAEALKKLKGVHEVKLEINEE